MSVCCLLLHSAGWFSGSKLLWLTASLASSKPARKDTSRGHRTLGRPGCRVVFPPMWTSRKTSDRLLCIWEHSELQDAFPGMGVAGSGALGASHKRLVVLLELGMCIRERRKDKRGFPTALGKICILIFPLATVLSLFSGCLDSEGNFAIM